MEIRGSPLVRNYFLVLKNYWTNNKKSKIINLTLKKITITFYPFLVRLEAERDNVPFKYDISANFIFIDKWTLGLSYRNNQVMSAMTGFQISNLLYLGYGYDFEVGDLVTNYDGTYEFFLRYEIFDSTKRNFSDKFF